jgi:hypothetical protein
MHLPSLRIKMQRVAREDHVAVPWMKGSGNGIDADI